MKQHVYILFKVIMCTILSVVLNSECTNLFIGDSVIIENTEFNITCNSSNSSTHSAWTKGNITFYVANNEAGDCFMQGNDESITRCYHNDPYTYIVTILPHSDQHGEQWSCRINIIRSNIIILNVSVPVKNVTLGESGQSTLSLNENIKTDISCVTFYGRPRANITWYIEPTYQSTTRTYLSGSEVCNTLTKHQDLVSVNCTKTVSFNRTYNDWYLVCTAENIDNYTPVASGSVKLNVTYTTNSPTISCANNGVYKVIHNHTGNISCSVDGGNPAGILHWNCTGDITQQRGPNNNVSQTIVWTATQTQYCTCSSTNIAGTRSTSVYIDVLYPPVLSDIQNQTVFEGDSVILQCDVIRANPPVYMTRWTSNKHNVSGTTLSLLNVTRYDDMIYTCTVYNTMDPSCHHVVQGNTSKSVHLDVLYPPSVNITPGKSFTVKEGDTLKYTCPVVPGNPTSTNVTWKRSHDTKVWTSSELLIHNVSRYDDSIYTCYVTNVMVNSNGTTQLGHARADIRLIVQYRASVTYFHVRNYPDNTSIVVMEHTSLTFECRVQGNPTADVKIYESGNEVKGSNTNELFYDTTTACCGKPVLYSCHGNNALNNKPSTREVQILVRCKPRPDPNVNIQYNETSAINHTVTLSYTALAYPHPTFIWYRHGSSIDINDPRIIISSSNLQTNLTITHVEENDFGQYVVNATNDVGSNITYMYLKPQGVPEVPTNLKQINSTTTESIISLEWTPGFNNGLKQTFTLMYRKQLDGTWRSINVLDTGEQNIRYNITGLTQDTTYDVILFAFNDLGRSRSNVTLSCRTSKKPRVESTEESGVSTIVGAAGGSAAGVVLLGVIIGVVIFKRRFGNTSKSTTSEQTPSTSPATYENLKMDPTSNESPIKQNETSDHTYEGLSSRNNGKENEYSSLSDKRNTDAKVTYENLKI